MNCYVDVTSYGAHIKIKNFKITKIRYIPKTTCLTGPTYLKNAEGKYVYESDGRRKKLIKSMKTYPAKWMAYSLKTDKKLEIEHKHLRETISEMFLNQAKEVGLK